MLSFPREARNRLQKENGFPDSSGSASDHLVGPLLREVIGAQRTAERVVAYPHLRDFAGALIAHCRDLNRPLVWPVGEPAERLAGAAVLLSEGDVRVRGWSDELRGERVLLVAVAAVTTLALVHAGQCAHQMGASEVHACGIEVARPDPERIRGILDTYTVLAAPLERRVMLSPV